MAAGTVSATSDSRESWPRVASMRATSSSRGPMWREAKVSVGARSSRQEGRAAAVVMTPLSRTGTAGGLLRFGFDEGLVRGGVHEGGHVGRVGQAHGDHPAL